MEKAVTWRIKILWKSELRDSSADHFYSAMPFCLGYGVRCIAWFYNSSVGCHSVPSSCVESPISAGWRVMSAHQLQWYQGRVPDVLYDYLVNRLFSSQPRGRDTKPVKPSSIVKLSQSSRVTLRSCPWNCRLTSPLGTQM